MKLALIVIAPPVGSGLLAEHTGVFASAVLYEESLSASQKFVIVPQPGIHSFTFTVNVTESQGSLASRWLIFQVTVWLLGRGRKEKRSRPPPVRPRSN